MIILHNMRIIYAQLLCTYDRQRNPRRAGARFAFDMTMIYARVRSPATGDLQIYKAHALLKLVSIVLFYTLILAFLFPGDGRMIVAVRIVRFDRESNNFSGGRANRHRAAQDSRRLFLGRHH